MSEDSRPRASAEISSHPLDEELVLYDSQTGQSFALNATGAKVWELCDGAQTVAAIAEQVARTYGLNLQEALSDVQELLGDLRQAGLVHF